MKPCPHCGSSLLESLVDSINDPHQEESCPKGPAKSTIAPVFTLRPITDVEADRLARIVAFGFDRPEDAA